MKVPRRGLFALAVGFLFPSSLAYGRQPIRESPSELPLPLPKLRLTKKPVMESNSVSIGFLRTSEYICPIHGNIGPQVMTYTPGPYPGQPKSIPAITACSFCLFDQLKKLPIAQL